ncbi:Flp pilus assembly protein CpaB [Marinomonas ostreistagni]|uniref:Flp pilus assembly protein CpaB n=1 Tax=Marinomonas ostreistagni TaxID=359209 RepID=A0ABS0ZCS8_9GAMM|nr:Flp pilus assembly protein CpaB [Marinomonas ostreistagni]MBJ7551477.1 Flp pilus assembly protein CpaB [Marinomonas ostreistagni]
MRSRFLMIVSLIILGIGLIGILVLKATSTSSTTSNQSAASAPVVQEKTFLVWVAKKELSIGEPITRQALRLEKMSEAKALEFGIKQDTSMEFVDGMVAKREVSESQPIYPEDISYPGQSGYVELIIEPGYVPVSISVPKTSVVGGGITEGSTIDLLVLTSSTQNLSGRPKIVDLDSVSLAPLFTGIKVLQVNLPKQDPTVTSKLSSSPNTEATSSEISLVLQLTRKQVAKLTIAKTIAQLEVHLSTGESLVSDLTADSGDILSDYKAVRELRSQSQILQ